MDTKTARRNFYQLKSLLNCKYHEQYSSERFSDDLQDMLSQFIPNATLKQLTKFMEKKFNKIIKFHPQVQTALKKVLKDKLNTMIETIKKQQLEKIFNFFKRYLKDGEFVYNNREYIFQPTEKKSESYENRTFKIFKMENVVINLLTNTSFILDDSKSRNAQNPYYSLTYTYPEFYCVENFASTFLLSQQKFVVNRGNFERQANNFLYKLVAFTTLMNATESQNA